MAPVVSYKALNINPAYLSNALLYVQILIPPQRKTRMKKSFKRVSVDLMCVFFFFFKQPKLKLLSFAARAWCFRAACTPSDCSAVPQSPSFALQITLISGHSGEDPLKAPAALRVLITEMFLLSPSSPVVNLCPTNRQGQRSQHHFCIVVV